MQKILKHSGSFVVAFIVIAAIWFLYSIREFRVFHGPLFWLSKYPFMWQLGVLCGLICAAPFAIAAYRGRGVKRNGYSPTFKTLGSYRAAWAFGTYLVVGAIASLAIGLPIARMQTAVATYKHYSYTFIKTLPQGGAVRILPKEIADQMAVQSGNTSGYANQNGHIVLDPQSGKLVWTYEEAPHGLVNSITKQTQGIAVLSANVTDREMQQFDADGQEFCYAPSHNITDSIRWQVLKRHYFVDPEQAVGIVTRSGEPLFIDSYIKYVGWPFKHPEVGGVMVFHDKAHGCKVEDLSVKQAEARPDLIASGRIFPEQLARDVQNDYGYKHGAWNTMFSHRDQTEVTNVDGNPMPYLMAFKVNGKEDLKWVSIAEPYGRAYATNAIFLTDAITGKTEVWKTTKNETLTGAARSVATVESLPGIVWSNFTPIEPRPAFIQGRLQYMLSVVPTSVNANTVSQTVFVDAASNRVVAIFNNGDPNGDAKIQAYLETGKLDAANAINGSSVLPINGSGNGSNGGTQSNETLAQQIDKLIAENQQMQQELQTLHNQVAGQKSGK